KGQVESASGEKLPSSNSKAPERIGARASSICQPVKEVVGRSTGQRFMMTVLTAQLIAEAMRDRKSTRLNSSHVSISYAVFCLKSPASTEIYTLSLHDALPI